MPGYIGKPSSDVRTVWLPCPLLLPTSVFEVAVGYAFGFPRGLAITWAGKTAGGIVAFLLGRSLLRCPTPEGLCWCILPRSCVLVDQPRGSLPMAINSFYLFEKKGFTSIYNLIFFRFPKLSVPRSLENWQEVTTHKYQVPIMRSL